MALERLPGKGWLALIGGGEFSFGETLEADRAWLERSGQGAIGFLPTASGSADYGSNFSRYLAESFSREVEIIPVYRQRDARREKNRQRIIAAPAVYLGGGLADQMLETLCGSPAAEGLEQLIDNGGVVVAIAAAAQALGSVVRGLEGKLLTGMGWLLGGVVETNFDPAHDRRFRRLLQHPDVSWGVGIPSGAALLLGPEREIEVVGASFLLESEDGEFTILGEI